MDSFVFVKINKSIVVSSNDEGLSLQLLTKLGKNQIDLERFGLAAGAYTITVSATSAGLDESEVSNTQEYKK